MYKGTRKLDESSINRSTLNQTILSETTNQVIQREIDNYTRLLEQDKRKFFRLQENRSQVLREHAQKQKELEILKSRQFKTDMLKKKGELKILERELDQTINSYNEVLASNKRCKAEIDELRKEKINQKEATRRLTSKIQQLTSLISEQQNQVLRKKDCIEENKQEILKIKVQNETQAREFRDQVSVARGSLGLSKSRQPLFKRKSEMEQKNEATDTQPLVRYRLRQILAKNKERIRIIENYRKSMSAIWQAFEEIKQESGNDDLQEITSTFLKRQQQNHFIYEYISKLNKEIQDLADNRQALLAKIEQQKQLNAIYAARAGPTPEKVQLKKTQTESLAEYTARIQQFENFLKKGEPLINDLRQAVGLTKDDLSQFNLEETLSQIENMITSLVVDQDTQHHSFKEELTKYSRSPPGILDDIKDKQERLIDGQKLREFANTYWQKRRAKIEIK